MTIEFKGESIEVSDWENSGVEPPAAIIPPRIQSAVETAPGVTFICEIAMEIGDVFMESASGVKYQVSDQQGIKYWALPV